MQHEGARFRHQLRRQPVVQHGEMPGHIGFQRKLVQQRLAEGVDGLDLQPARRFQRLRKQPPRPGKPGAGRGRSVDGCNFLCQLIIAQSDPQAEDLEHTGRHLGSGRLGEGEAQNARGIGAIQQLAHHPAGENEGLARARIGAHPGRGVGPGGKVLPLKRCKGDLRPAHSLSSEPLAHSFTRAR